MSFWLTTTMEFIYIPGGKDCANMWLMQALMGTTQLHVVAHEILAIPRPVTPKHAGTSDAIINEDGISMLQ